MHSNPSDMEELLAGLLAPCLCPEPTSGAVVLITGGRGASFTLLNVAQFEAIVMLRVAADEMEKHMGSAAPGMLQ